jgi:hypothetical protein
MDGDTHCVYSYTWNLEDQFFIKDKNFCGCAIQIVQKPC